MGRRGLTAIGTVAALAITFLAMVLPAAQGATTTRVSVSSSGGQGDRYVFGPTSISADGRYVAFESWSTNLIPGDTNGVADVFRHDRVTGETIRVSVASDGTQAHYRSHDPKLSGDGRFVLFLNMSLGPHGPVYVHDCLTGETKGAAVPSERALVNADAADISSDGTRVAYGASCSGILPGVSGCAVYVYDFNTGQTTLASVTSDGTPVSGDDPDLSADGRFVAFCGPSDATAGFAAANILVRDCLTGQTTAASVSSSGAPANNICMDPAISGDGRYVAFKSIASNLPQPGDGNWAYYVHDRVTGETRLVGPGASGCSAFSANGRYFAFESYNRTLVPGDTNNCADVFVYDWVTSITRRVSVTDTGAQGLGSSTAGSRGPSVSADGRCVAFVSRCYNLVPGDTNNEDDAFVRDTLVVPPIVMTSVPQGTTVSTTSAVIKVAFSMPMDQASVQSAFSMSPNKTGTFSWVGNEMSYTVSSALAYSTTYAITIAATATSSSGVALAAPFSWNFTTAKPPPPIVVSRSPEGTGCSNAGPITIGFDQAMDMASVQNAFSLSPIRAGTFSWSGNEMSYSPSRPLAYNASYKVTLGATAKSALGGSLPSEVSWTFKTVSAPPPTVLSVAPTGTSCSIQSAVIRVVFSTPMKRLSAQGAFSIVPGVAGGFSWSGNQMLYRATSALTAGTSYTVTIASSATSAAGQPLGAAFVWTFKTGDIPTVVSYAPKGTGIAITSKLVVRFSVPMKQLTVQDALYLNGAKVTTGTFVWAGNKLTYTPAANWLKNKRYQVKLTTAAKSRAGVPLAADVNWDFTTGAAAPTLVTASAASTATGAQVILNLASAADVTVTIRNLAGREIAVLTPGQLGAGIQSLRWSGRSSTGTKAPAGVYLLQVTARGADGECCSAVAPVQR